MQNIGKIAAVVCGVAFCYWLTLPPTGLALDNSCRLTAFQPSVSEAIWGSHFWKSQQDEVDAELEILRQLTAAADKTNETLKSSMSPIKSRMTRLSNGDISGSNEEDRAEALLREQRERYARLGHLLVCRAVIVKHLPR